MLEYRMYVRPNDLNCKNISFMYGLFLSNTYMRLLFQREIANVKEYWAHVRFAWHRAIFGDGMMAAWRISSCSSHV